MERAATIRNSHKLFHFIQTLGVSEANYKVHDSPIRNHQRRPVRWAERFQSRFGWPAASAPPSAVLESVRWLVATDPPNEAETLREIRAFRSHKAPSSNGLSPALFKGRGIELASWSGPPIIILTFKKGLRNDCADHRNISPIPVESKLYSSVIFP